jgi:chromosome segregation ATPase
MLLEFSLSRFVRSTAGPPLSCLPKCIVFVCVQTELKDLEKKIAAKKRDQDRLHTLFDQRVGEENKLKERLAANQQRFPDLLVDCLAFDLACGYVRCSFIGCMLGQYVGFFSTNELYAKQNRKATFGSKKERDKYLNTQISEIQKALEAQEQQLASNKKESKESETRRTGLIRDLEKKETEIKNLKTQLDAAITKHKSLSEERDEKQNSRKEAWRLENDMQTKVNKAEADLTRASQALQMTMDRELFRGLEAVTKMAKDHKMAGVYGPLIELFSCG